MRASIGFNLDLQTDEIVSFAKLAEQSGFEGCWVHEHSFGRDAVSTVSAVSASTGKLKLGFGCLSPYIRSPVTLAMTSASLQEASQGRLALGIGTGFPARLDLMGIEHKYPISAVKESIQICRQMWKGELVNFQGKSFKLKNVKSLTGEAKSKIPIYVAGWKTQMLKLTARHADGYLAKGGESSVSLSHIVSDISSSISPRTMDEIDVAAYLLTVVDSSKKEAISKAKKDPFVAYMLSVQDDYLYEGTGIDPALKRPIAENYFRGNIAGAFDSIRDEMIEAFTLVGTVDQVCDRVGEYKRSGLKLPILQPIIMKPEDVRQVMQLGSTLFEQN